MQELSKLHLAAIAYAEQGIPVFPCRVGEKSPITPNGFHDATTDIEQINLWWNENENYNIGFSPAMANLTVIDLDPEYKLPQALPPTYSVKTPRGVHAYFAGITKSSASKIGEHVDIRSEGGYVLAPPSVVNGATYQVIEDLDYAPLPQWVIDAAQKPASILKATVEEVDLEINIQRAKDWIGTIEGAVEGQGGDEYTYKVCCQLRDFGVSELTALDILYRVWNKTCNPEWNLEELQQKILNAYRYGQNDQGVIAIESPQVVFGAIVEKLYPIKRSRFYFKDEGEQDNEPEPRWIIKDLISERSTVLLYGPTQSYKSFLTLDVALGIASATETFGTIPKEGKVFYAALEGRAHLRKARRSWKLAKQLEGKIHNFFLGLAPMVGVPGEIKEFCDEVMKRCKNPKLIIIDTLGKAMAGLNENDAKDAGLFIQFCDGLVEVFGCSVIAIHHTGKDKDRGARGSSAFHAGFDTVLEVKAKRETKAVEVWVRKHKDAEEREFPWTFEGRALGGSLAFFETTPDAHRLLTQEEKELSATKIGAALQELGAYGENDAVTTNILSEQLTPKIENQDLADYEQSIGRLSRVLISSSRSDLAGYCIGYGKARKWMLPKPK